MTKYTTQQTRTTTKNFPELVACRFWGILVAGW